VLALKTLQLGFVAKTRVMANDTATLLEQYLQRAGASVLGDVGDEDGAQARSAG
jgi:hypothetical protein